MKLWTLTTSLTVSLLILSGCGTPKPAAPESAVIDKTLPIVSLTKNGLIMGMKSVAFEWHSITNPKVKGIYIYKQSPSKQGESKLTYYTTIKNRFSTHYLDTDVIPNTKYAYAFRTYGESAEGMQSRSIAVTTLPILDSVSWIHSITGMPKAAKILWRPDSNERVKAYTIERKNLQEDRWEKIATVEGRLNAEYIDTGLKNNYVYLYRVRVLTYDGITSAPSKIVKVVTKPLPTKIINITATRNQPHKINIKWSKSYQKDFALYYLYRADKIDGNYELIAKLHNNRFTDKIPEDGKVYYYRVSAVDKNGLESLHEKSSIQGMTLGAPSAPGIIDAKLFGDSIKIQWSKPDLRSVKYMVRKKHKKGWFKEDVEEYDVSNGTTFIDKKIEPNSTYTYTVFALDKNSIKSLPSVEVKVITPESDKVIQEKAVKNNTSKKVATPKVIKSKDVISPSDNIDLSGL